MEISPNPDLPDVASVLALCGLPGDDIEPAFLPDFVLARQGANPAGVAGMQRLGASALVRSVAVDPRFRSQGLGSRLVAEVERRARGNGVRQLYLLTHDAQPFFARLGYRAVERDCAPPEIRQTAQYASSCCCGATLMAKPLEA